MVVNQEELVKLISRLKESDKKTAYDFLQFLIHRSSNSELQVRETEQIEYDDEELTKEELDQLESDCGYITWEEAKKVYGISGEI